MDLIGLEYQCCVMTSLDEAPMPHDVEGFDDFEVLKAGRIDSNLTTGGYFQVEVMHMVLGVPKICVSKKVCITS